MSSIQQHAIDEASGLTSKIQRSGAKPDDQSTQQQQPRRPGTKRPASAAAVVTAREPSRLSARPTMRRRPRTATGTFAKHISAGHTGSEGQTSNQDLTMSRRKEVRCASRGARPTRACSCGMGHSTSSENRSGNLFGDVSEKRHPCSDRNAATMTRENEPTWWYNHENLASDPRVMRNVEAFVTKILHKEIHGEGTQHKNGHQQQLPVRATLLRTGSHECEAFTLLPAAGEQYSEGERSKNGHIASARCEPRRTNDRLQTKVSPPATKRDEATAAAAARACPYPPCDQRGIKGKGTGRGTRGPIGRNMIFAQTAAADEQEVSTTGDGCNHATADATREAESTLIDNYFAPIPEGTTARVNPSVFDVLGSMRPSLERQRYPKPIATGGRSSRQHTTLMRHRSPAINSHVHRDRPPPQPPPPRFLHVDREKVCSWTSIFGAVQDGASRGRARRDALDAARRRARQHKRRERRATAKTDAGFAASDEINAEDGDGTADGIGSPSAAAGNGQISAGSAKDSTTEDSATACTSERLDSVHGESISRGSPGVNTNITTEEPCVENCTENGRGTPISQQAIVLSDGEGHATVAKNSTAPKTDNFLCLQHSGDELGRFIGHPAQLNQHPTATDCKRPTGRGAGITRAGTTSQSLLIYPEAKKLLSGWASTLVPLRKRPERFGETPRLRPWTASGVHSLGSRVALVRDYDHRREQSDNRLSANQCQRAAAGAFGWERRRRSAEGGVSERRVSVASIGLTSAAFARLCMVSESARDTPKSAFPQR